MSRSDTPTYTLMPPEPYPDPYAADLVQRGPQPCLVCDGSGDPYWDGVRCKRCFEAKVRTAPSRLAGYVVCSECGEINPGTVSRECHCGGQMTPGLTPATWPERP